MAGVFQKFILGCGSFHDISIGDIFVHFTCNAAMSGLDFTLWNAVVKTFATDLSFRNLLLGVEIKFLLQ